MVACCHMIHWNQPSAFVLSDVSDKHATESVHHMQVLWAANDGSRHVWREIATQGTPPTPRFHHSCDSYDRKSYGPNSQPHSCGCDTDVVLAP